MKLACFFLLAVSAAMVKAASNDAETLKHLKDREGYATVGYFPTADSGVTIGIGIDLGQQTLTGLAAKGISATILTKLTPYIGYRSKAALTAAGLNEKNLVLTTSEADALSLPFIKELNTIVTPYSANMDIKGHAALVSLRHWAGSLGCTGCKLSISSPTGEINPLWQAISGKTATNAQVRAALIKTRDGKAVGTVAYNRLNHEITYLA